MSAEVRWLRFMRKGYSVPQRPLLRIPYIGSAKAAPIKRLGESGLCPNCLYIGEAKNCSCQWTIRMVAEGKGTDPDVVRNAKVIIECAERQTAA